MTKFSIPEQNGKEILGTKADEKFTLAMGALTIHDVDYRTAAAFDRLQTVQERVAFIEAHLHIRELKERGYQIVQTDSDHDSMGGNNPAPSPLDIQIAGDHYKSLKIQPIEYIQANQLGYEEGNVVKYVTRWESKGGRKDLEKAIHYLQLLLASDRAQK